MLPFGETPREAFSEGFFQVAAAQTPKPQTVAIAGEDAEFPRNAIDGARNNIKKYGFKTVYNQTYPPSTTDFSPIIRAIKATNPDLVFICSYPLSSVGMLLSANELGLKPKMMGGGMVGLQATAIKNKLKSRLNGIVNYETWVPSPKLMAPAAGFFQEIPGARPRPRHRPTWLLSRRMGLRLSAGARRRNRGGEERQRRRRGGLSAQPRVRYHHGVRHQVRQERRMDKRPWLAGPISRHYRCGDLETWRGMSYQTVLTPADEKTGDLIYPYEKALG
jgi:branched-chain amino acid transport system substrate-binding protein